MLKGPPLMLLPSLLAGTINEYSISAINQLTRIAPTSPMFFNKAMSLNFKCPYQAMVMKVFEAISNNMV
jgi:hypothetical protein